MFFPQRLRKLNVSFFSIIIISLLFSSCSSSKSASLAYMDDIYYNSFTVPKAIAALDKDLEEDEDGTPPENVPGAAYVYQPIAEPGIENPSSTYYGSTNPYYPNGYYGDDYYSPYYSGPGSPYYSDFYSPYLSGYGSSIGLSYNGFYPNYGGYFSLGFGYSWGSNNYYAGSGGGYSCPSASSGGGSSTVFVSKRFSWNENPEQSINYITKVADSVKGTDNNERKPKSRKSTYTKSNTSESNSSNKWKNFFDTISNGTNSGTSEGSTTRSKSTNSSYGTRSSGSSRSSGTRSGGSSRSSGSSSSYSGKRIK
jgi:hypothetical protein